MKKRIIFIVLLVAVAAGMAFAEDWKGDSTFTYFSVPGFENVDVQLGSPFPFGSKDALYVTYKSETSMAKGGIFYLTVRYTDGTIERGKNTEILIVKGENHHFLVDTKKGSKTIKSVTISFEKN